MAQEPQKYAYVEKTHRNCRSVAVGRITEENAENGLTGTDSRKSQCLCSVYSQICLIQGMLTVMGD
jgi:hypothetical protein